MSIHHRAHRAPGSIVSSLVAVVAAAPAGLACDLCSLPTAPDGGVGLSLALYGQYTDFGTLRSDGEKVDNEVGQYLRSTVTQLVVAYRFDEIYAVHAVVPYIHRAFRRPEGFEIDEGVEQGLGDVSLMGSMRVLQLGEGAAFLRIDDLGGLKLPTGRSARLGEEAEEVVVPGAPESGVHGHDLALGSGSWDVILGEEVSARFGSCYASLVAQYTIRTRGTHDYQYANDLTWSFAPGFDAWRTQGASLGLEAVLSGEAKGKDVAGGEVAGDTGMVAVYLGPQVSAEFRGRGSAQLGADFPLVQNATSLQLVPDYRVRGNVSWRF